MIGRFCEFIKIDKNGDFVGAMRNSAAWAGACQREAERIFKFENHNAFLCQTHYDVLIAWVKE